LLIMVLTYIFNNGIMIQTDGMGAVKLLKTNLKWRKPALLLTLCSALIAGCGASESGDRKSQPSADGKQEVNVYTARNYDVDKQLYAQFTETTGIKVNLIEGKAEELIERLKREGDSTSADLFVTVDGGVLNNAKLAGVLQPIESDTIRSQVPDAYWDTDKTWVGLSKRARVVVYSRERVQPEQLSTYEDLATDKWKGKLLVRSSSSLYNLSLIASLIELNGEDSVEQWAKGIVGNLARSPEGGDRDQAKAIAAGIGDLAIMNTYYFGQMLNSKDPEEVKVAEQLGVFFPNQGTSGTHVNVSGAGLIKSSKNKENALKLIEYLTGKEAQETVASQNFEFPVNPDAKKPELLESWGEFEAQKIEFSKLGEHNKKAVEIANKVGWK